MSGVGETQRTPYVTHHQILPSLVSYHSQVALFFIRAGTGAAVRYLQRGTQLGLRVKSPLTNPI